MRKYITQTAVLGLLLFITVQIASAQERVRVATPLTLQDVLQKGLDGGEILLEEGDYGTLSLRNILASSKTPLVIGSVDPDSPARFARLSLENVHNVILQDLIFNYTFQPEDPPHLRPFDVSSSDSVTIRRSTFNGDVARERNAASDGFGTAYGIGINESENVRLQENKISGFLRGIVVNGSQNVTIIRNELYNLRSDGMNFAQVSDVIISENYLHDFLVSAESKDHADMIQFWTRGSKLPSSGIVIRENILSSGNGRFTQSIFMRNEQVDQGLAGAEMFYSDILIEGNVIINAHLHGITVGATDGLTVKNNTVVRNKASSGDLDNVSLWTPKIGVAAISRNVEITNNVTSAITGFENQLDWIVNTNLLVQDVARMKPGFYGNVFVRDVLADQSRVASFAPLVGGPLDNTGIGSPLLDSLD